MLIIKSIETLLFSRKQLFCMLFAHAIRSLTRARQWKNENILHIINLQSMTKYFVKSKKINKTGQDQKTLIDYFA